MYTTFSHQAQVQENKNEKNVATAILPKEKDDR